MTTILTLPGLYNSSDQHWQSHWERQHPSQVFRVHQLDWETPDCLHWMANLGAFIQGINGPVVLAAHSLGCALVAHWASQHPTAQVVGALMVAPSDVEAARYPKGTVGFGPMPLRELPFASKVVASSNDEWVSPERARYFALKWGSQLVLLENAGHISAVDGYGPWPEGWALLQSWLGA